jgi:hypothetical protein
LKQLITEKEINEIRKRHEYEKVARSFTVTALLHFLTRSGCKRRARTIRLPYKARWGVELFFRWIKQNANVPRLFGTTKNAVYNQLFAALLAYVIVNFVHETLSRKTQQRLSLLSFSRKLLNYQLPWEWHVAIQNLFTFFNLHCFLDVSG